MQSSANLRPNNYRQIISLHTTVVKQGMLKQANTNTYIAMTQGPLIDTLSK